MAIWVDADACPVAIRDIIVRAAVRTKQQTYFVANHFIPLPKYDWVTFRHVKQGFDEADNWIVAACQQGDLVITGDIPLANDAITQGASVVTPRGEALDKNNIKSRLASRDLMDMLRSSGIETKGPNALSTSDKHAFASQLDSYLQSCR